MTRMSPTLIRTKNTNRYRVAAKMHAARGWPVLPVKPRGKEPLVKDWPKQATTDIKQFKDWWKKWPDANIGILTGPKSGIWVLDIDCDEERGIDGEKSLSALEAEYGNPSEKFANGR